MRGYVKRLLRTGAAYQAADAVSKVIALGLLPLYTRNLTEADYGSAELLLTFVIATSIVVRLGVGEAFVRFHFLDADPARRVRVARTATAFVLVVTTVVAIAVAVAAAPLSRLVLGFEDAQLLRITALGLWAFTNLEIAYALLRVEERARAFLVASLTNVALTIALTVYLVVLRDGGAAGLLGGNFVASAVVLLGLWWALRERLALVPDTGELRTMLRFGLPTVPAELSVFALNLVDRFYLFRVESEDAAGLYSLAVKLAAVVVFTVRAFQYAWPPLAYSIEDDAEAGRVYAFVTTYYVLGTGIVVAGLALLGRWVVEIFAAPAFFEAHEALPWVALGWALYGLFLVLVAMAGRAQVTTRNFPAALAGLIVNVVLLVVLVPSLGIAGAGIALCGAYVVMLIVMYVLTRRLFAVAFEWRRLALAVGVIASVTVAGELALPDDGVLGLLLRVGAWALIAPALWLAGFFHAGERAWVRGALRRGRRRGGAAADTPLPDAAGPPTTEAPNTPH